MRCRAFAKRISAYLEGELGPADRERMEQHGALCRRCAERLKDVRDVRTSLKMLPRIHVSPAFSIGLRSRMQWTPASRPSLKERVRARVPSSRSLPAIAGLGAAAALGAMLLFGSPYRQDARSTPELLPLSSRIVGEDVEITNYVLWTVSPLELDSAWNDTAFSVRDEPSEDEMSICQVVF